MNSEPINELELVLNGTQSLSIADAERQALVDALMPIARRIPLWVQATITVENNADAAAVAQDRERVMADSKAWETLLREFSNQLIERLYKNHRGWTEVSKAWIFNSTTNTSTR